jgi:hypothetical protein
MSNNQNFINLDDDDN